ncbi:alpha/beta fold hydrolase [Pseudovibrio sp. SCP19]|uniref:alpha/beta fold hydrolase n=1 Tax=Pseudovibrio sp. SCP19 TaxID=3141374 RepID=UPI00333DD717
MQIVILPGLDGTGVLSWKIHEALTPHHKVVTLSYPPDLSQYDELKNWVHTQLPDEPFVIVAESFSGPLAIMIAAEHAEFLKGVTFVATFAQKPRTLPVICAYLFQIIPINSVFLTQLAQPFLMGNWSNRQFTSKFRQALSKVPASTLAKRLAGTLQVNVISMLTEINVPMMYLRAKNDRLVPRRTSAPFKHAAVTIYEIEGPHFLLQANPKETAAKISEFVESLD